VGDPYSIPGTDCLANKLGVADADELREVEAQLASIRDIQISRVSVPGSYGLAHLLRFHEILFSDVYDWAGRTRTVDISKPGVYFCSWRFVEDEVTAVLDRLKDDGFLAGVKMDEFVKSLAHYYGELNVRHPFREGNGRALRAFLRQTRRSCRVPLGLGGAQPRRQHRRVSEPFS